MELQTYVAIQNEVEAWALRNFDEQDSHRPLLGVFEEIGELARACRQAELNLIRDAIGDICIYMMHYCALRGWSFEEIFDGRGVDPGLYDNLDVVEKLSRHHLKGAQGIRGTAEVHDFAMKHIFGHVLCGLESVAEDGRMFLHACVQETWNKVKLRDWKKNPNNADKVAEEARCTDTPRPSDDVEAVTKALEDYHAETGQHASPTMMRQKMDLQALEDARVTAALDAAAGIDVPGIEAHRNAVTDG